MPRPIPLELTGLTKVFETPEGSFVAVENVNALIRNGEIWICAISKAVPIAIGRGENSGREVIYHNVVRNWLKRFLDCIR